MRGYLVRRGNGTIYPVVDRSIVVHVRAQDGTVGWARLTASARRATCEIINDLLAPVTIGADPKDVEHIWDEVYGLMRVRGCSGGFHVDAIAAIDIALSDLYGIFKQGGQSRNSAEHWTVHPMYLPHIKDEEMEWTPPASKVK
jgi:L-alanine-DL-glutamate epimerase-like enolase superfamily enzyme